jgi:lambda repressor-like predicted transcriptional regulator
MKGPIAQYLSRYAEPEAADAEHLHTSVLAPKNTYAQCLVVPAFDEAEDFLPRLLRNISDRQDLLVIIVVNAPKNEGQTSDDPGPIQRTLKLLRTLQTPKAKPPLDCAKLIIDRVSPERQIPHKQGVGLARKIASDVALALHHSGRITSPWIYQTDADACLPNDYFTTPMPQRGCAIFPHRHISDDTEVNAAARLYDLHMSYFVAALRKHGSAYAHPSLGSTLSIHALDYANVRGYPKRSAGEDFHILNKLSKITPLTLLPSPSIEVQARTSARVPFGTGPALSRIIENLRQQPNGSGYLSYNYASFKLLAQGLAALEAACQSTQGAKVEFPPQVSEILNELGLEKVLPKLTDTNTPRNQRQRVATEWFDALKTLRFIHLARRFYPDKSLLETLRSEAGELQLLDE